MDMRRLAEPIYKENIRDLVDEAHGVKKLINDYYLRLQHQGAPPELLNYFAWLYQYADALHQGTIPMLERFVPEPNTER